MRKKNRTKILWIRVTPEQHKEIKELAEGKELSMSDFLVCKALGLVPEYKKEITEYYVRGKRKEKIVNTMELIKPPSL